MPLRILLNAQEAAAEAVKAAKVSAFPQTALNTWNSNKAAAKSRASMDLSMGLLEDLPEFAIDIVFLAMSVRAAAGGGGGGGGVMAGYGAPGHRVARQSARARHPSQPALVARRGARGGVWPLLARTCRYESNLSGAELGLFVISAVLSLYHIIKCLWTYRKIGSAVAAVDVAGAGPDDLDSVEQGGPGFGFGPA